MAQRRFLASLRRSVPFIGFHHVLMLVLVIVIVLLSIVLAGCSSYSTMTNVYIFGLSYTNSTPSDLSPTEKNISETLSGFKGSSQLEVRTGYFGMCVRQRGILWLCSADTNGLAQQVGSENDPLNLIGMASKFKNDVLFSGLLFMAIILSLFTVFLLSTFSSWHKEHNQTTGSDVDVKLFPSRPVSEAALSCVSVGAIVCFVASLWQHVGSVGAAAMAETANYGNVESTIGSCAMAMAWIGFSFLALVAIALLVAILSVIVLDRLTGD